MEKNVLLFCALIKLKINLVFNQDSFIFFDGDVSNNLLEAHTCRLETWGL